MRFIAELRSWFRAAFRRPDLNREIGDELQLHVDLYAADLRRRGVPAVDAARLARLELGGFDGRREACRQSLGLRLIDELRADVRYTFRLLRRSPVFTAVAVVSLGLGIGANTAIFSLVDAVLLKSLPVARPERLFFVDNSGGKSKGSSGPPYPCYELLRDHSEHFSGLAMFAGQRFRITINGAEERVRGQYASGNYFAVLGVPAAYGRMLTPADDRRVGSGGPDGPVVVISYDFWKRRFGMDAGVLGQRVLVGTKWMTIVGVTRAEFFGLTVGSPVDVTVPVIMAETDLSRKQSWWFSVVGRLRDGAAVEAARSELDGLFRTYMTSLQGRAPAAEDYFNRIELVPANRGLHEIRGQFSTPLTIVMVIVGVVLVIGCANVANLLLARASARQSEMALRLAIGAGRARLIRQLLTEGIVLSVLGAAAGLVLAHWSVDLLVRMVGSTRQQIVLDPHLDARVLGFTTVVAALTGVLCSLFPALRTTRVTRANVSDGSRIAESWSRRRMGQSLVVLQVTLSLVLLCGAALFVRTLRNLEHFDAGFRPEGVLTMPVEAIITTPPKGTDEQAAKSHVGQMWADLADKVRTMPGVQSASAATLSPLSGRDRGVNLSVVDGPPIPDANRDVHLNQVTAEHFKTYAIRVVTGRLFDESDRPTSRKVAILGETAARAYFGRLSPIGRLIRFSPTTEPREIVGVVEDARYESLRTDAGRMVYLPMPQPLDVIRSATLAVRAAGDPGALVPAIREEVRRTLPGGFATETSTLQAQVEGSLLQERLVSMLGAVFGALALALASVGLYGLLAYGVVRRTHEFGIRMAIGASRVTMLWLVLRETLGLVLTALACGVAAVLVLGRYIQSVLFEVPPTDPIAIGGAVAALLLVAMTAAYFPARRASRINPTTALRHD